MWCIYVVIVIPKAYRIFELAIPSCVRILLPLFMHALEQQDFSLFLPYPALFMLFCISGLGLASECNNVPRCSTVSSCGTSVPCREFILFALIVFDSCLHFPFVQV